MNILYLDDNQIGDKGCIALGEGLKNLINLNELYLIIKIKLVMNQKLQYVKTLLMSPKYMFRIKNNIINEKKIE